MKKTAHIMAEVHLVAEAKASHFGQSPRDSYPTILTVAQKAFSSQVLIEDTSVVKPGAVIEVQFRFLVPGNAQQIMTPGVEFDIWERETVGRGKVIKITSAEQTAPADRQ